MKHAIPCLSAVLLLCCLTPPAQGQQASEVSELIEQLGERVEDEVVGLQERIEHLQLEWGERLRNGMEAIREDGPAEPLPETVVLEFRMGGAPTVKVAAATPHFAFEHQSKEVRSGEEQAASSSHSSGEGVLHPQGDDTYLLTCHGEWEVEEVSGGAQSADRMRFESSVLIKLGETISLGNSGALAVTVTLQPHGPQP